MKNNGVISNNQLLSQATSDNPYKARLVTPSGVINIEAFPSGDTSCFFMSISGLINYEGHFYFDLSSYNLGEKILMASMIDRFTDNHRDSNTIELRIFIDLEKEIIIREISSCNGFVFFNVVGYDSFVCVHNNLDEGKVVWESPGFTFYDKNFLLDFKKTHLGPGFRIKVLKMMKLLINQEKIDFANEVLKIVKKPEPVLKPFIKNNKKIEVFVNDSVNKIVLKNDHEHLYASHVSFLVRTFNGIFDSKTMSKLQEIIKHRDKETFSILSSFATHEIEKTTENYQGDLNSGISL